MVRDTERWLSGRKRPPAKWVRDENLFSGSNPDLSATLLASHPLKAMTRLVPLLALFLLSALAPAHTLVEYLRLRKTNGVTNSVGVRELRATVGKRVLEIRGVVKGTFSSADRAGIMIEGIDGETETIDAPSVPEWLVGNEVPVRLLVRAERAERHASLSAVLIAAAPETDVRAVETKPKPSAKAAKAARSKPWARPSILRKRHSAHSRGGSVRRGRTWTLRASEVTPVYAGFIKRRNPRLSNAEAMRIAEGIVGFSLQQVVDARLIMAIVMVESGFNPFATSRAGAMGLGQLMPGTARGLGVRNSYDSIENLYGAVRLIRGHLATYRRSTGDEWKAIQLTLAAYNAGPGAVRRYGGIPPYRETQKYVRKVVEMYRTFVGR